MISHMENAQIESHFLKNWGHVTFEMGKEAVVRPVFEGILDDLDVLF